MSDIATRTTGKSKADTPGADNSIEFINNSIVVWNVDKNQKPPNEFGYNLISWPSSALSAEDGTASCIVEDILSKIGAGGTGNNNYFYFCWNDGSWRFGVRININVQVFGMGDRPSWEIMYDQSLESGTISWQSNGSNPADQYVWPSSLGYKIVATPTSEHQSLSIKVEISALD